MGDNIKIVFSPPEPIKKEESAKQEKKPYNPNIIPAGGVRGCAAIGGRHTAFNYQCSLCTRWLRGSVRRSLNI